MKSMLTECCNRAAASCCSALLAALFPGIAAAADFPTRTIRYIVPSAPGGNADIVARLVGERLAKSFGQQVIVENRPGANNVIATEFVVKSPPDGYTLLQVANSHVTNPSVLKQLPYDTVRDLAPVGLLASTPLVLVVHPALPVRNVKDLLTLARVRPGELNYHSSGIGTAGHLAGVLLGHMAHVKIVPVPYRGTAQAMTDVISGDLHFSFPSLTLSLPIVKSGKLRALAMTGLNRTPLSPDIPTVSESGLPGYQASIWNGVLVPAATPQPMIAKLNAEIVRSLTGPEVRERFAASGSDVAPSSPDEFAAFIRAEIPRWAAVIKAAGIKAE
jgi:tripartite-type tricarboxylate transporter receptor subunit TctC